jgi:hypothetical protein
MSAATLLRGLSQFARTYLESLQETHPDRVAALEAKGELRAHLEEVDQRAREMYQDQLVSLQRKHPLPEHPMDRAQALEVLASMAREAVYAEILVPDLEDEKAFEPDGRVAMSERPAPAPADHAGLTADEIRPWAAEAGLTLTTPQLQCLATKLDAYRLTLRRKPEMRRGHLTSTWHWMASREQEA